MPHILLAADGSEHDLSSVAALGRMFAGTEGVRVTVLTVGHLRFPSPPVMEMGFVPVLPSAAEMERWEVEIKEDAARIVAEAEAALQVHGFQTTSRVEWGPPAEMIVRVAGENDFDLIAIGSRGAGQVSGILVGSVSDRVVHSAHIPVLVIRN